MSARNSMKFGFLGKYGLVLTIFVVFENFRKFHDHLPPPPNPQFCEIAIHIPIISIATLPSHTKSLEGRFGRGNSWRWGPTIRGLAGGFGGVGNSLDLSLVAGVGFNTDIKQTDMILKLQYIFQ